MSMHTNQTSNESPHNLPIIPTPIDFTMRRTDTETKTIRYPIRVSLVEDNRELREGISSLLKIDSRFQCMKLYANAESFLDEIDESDIDVVLMDIGLPEMNGVECVRKLKEVSPSTHVIMVTVFDHDDKIFQSICAGASGYLLKETPPQQILTAIDDIMNGGAPMTPRIAKRVLDMFSLSCPLPQPMVLLSSREREVLEKLVRGLSYKMIAEELFISVHTVNSHLKVIYEKLQVHSKSEAVAKALREKIV